MERTTNPPATATRPNTAAAALDTNGPGSFDEQDRQGRDGQFGDKVERPENLTAVRDEPDNDRNDSRRNRDVHETFNGRDDRESDPSRDRHQGTDRHHGTDRHQGTDGGEYPEPDFRREQRAALSAGVDVYAPVLEAWQQIFKSWSELAATMVKVQQGAFARLTGAAKITAQDISLGDRRDGEAAFSGSRPTVSTPERIEHDRR